MVIIGARGMAKELLTAYQWNTDLSAQKRTNNTLPDLYFFDNVNPDTPDLLFNRFPVIKSWESLKAHFESKDQDFILGIGGSNARKFCAEKAIALGGSLCSFISDQAMMGDYGIKLSPGVCVLFNAVITTDIFIGEGTLVNNSALVSHDVTIGSYCELSPGSRILGRAKVGHGTEIGANAIILPDIIVGSGCRVGAGAVVTHNIHDNETVGGVPAKPLH